MKKFLLTTLVAIIATMPMRVSAQRYADLVVQLMQTNPEYYKLPQEMGEELKPVYAEINKKILADPALSEGLLQKYSETNLITDFVEVAFVPSFKESVTEGELKAYINMMNSVDGRLYQLHSNQANDKMSIEMLEVLLPVLTGLMEKGPNVNVKEYLKPVERKESIPADYVSAFNKFYGNGTLIETALNKIDLSKFKELNKDPKGTPIFEALISHLKSNMSTIMLNSYYGSVTEKDLEFGASLLSNPTYMKLMDKLIDTVMKLRNDTNHEEFGEKLIVEYVSWLQSHGVKFNSSGEALLQSISAHNEKLINELKAQQTVLIKEIDSLNAKCSALNVATQQKTNYIDEVLLIKGNEHYVYRIVFDVVKNQAEQKFMKQIWTILSKTIWDKNEKYESYHHWFNRYNKDFNSIKFIEDAQQYLNGKKPKEIVISVLIYAMNNKNVAFTVDINDVYNNIFNKQSYIYNATTDKLWKTKEIFTQEAISSLNLKSVVNNGQLLFSGDSLYLAKKGTDYNILFNLKEKSGILADEIKQLLIDRKTCIANEIAMAQIINEIKTTQAKLIKVSKEYRELTSKGKQHASQNQVEPTDSEEKVYEVVEQMPEFPGGNQKLFDWLSGNVKYPAIAEENGIQGRVIVRFVVERDGSISNVRVVKSIDPALDREAVHVVSSMPRWIPGKQKGETVRVKYTVPVTFRLQ